MSPTAAEFGSVRRALLRWYDAHRRDLPWRRTSDPYAIWISETMLQQTRVETVIPYYERFLARFPDVSALAEAEEDEVLTLWSGLGYYRRARALHAAACEIVAQYGGVFPRERGSVLGLSGIGPYTAGAVLSIAFSDREPLVDGNVARVFARLFGFEAPLRSAPLEKLLWRFAEALVPAGDPGAWNQGLMELGATVCTASGPKCARCPLRKHCCALAEGKVESLPVPAAKKPVLDVELELLLVERPSGVLLVQRPARGRMASMWELPTREVVSKPGTARLWPEAYRPPSCEPLPREAAGRGNGEATLLKHAITKHRIRARLVPGRFAGRGRASARAAECDWRFADATERQDLPLTGLTQKALRAQFRPG